MTAKDVLSIAQDKMAPRVQRALENVSRESEERGGAPSAPKTTVNPMLKGISEDLLAKVQLKPKNSPFDTRRLRPKTKRNFVSQRLRYRIVEDGRTSSEIAIQCRCQIECDYSAQNAHAKMLSVQIYFVVLIFAF